MDINVLGAFSSLFKYLAGSSIFFAIKLIAAFSIFILLIADILLLSKRLQTDVKIVVYGAKTPSFKKAKYTKWWESISGYAKEGTVSSGKIALVEANKMLEEVLEKVGYQGESLEEKINQIKPGQLVGLEDVMKAHKLFEKIIEDPSHEVGIGEIKEAVDSYEKVFRGLELFN